jgi:cytochrome b561
MTNTVQRRTSVFQALMSVHWWMAAFYVLLFVTGTFMSQLERGATGRIELYDLHKSLGLTTIIFLLGRILILLQVWGKKYRRRWPRLSWPWWRTTLLHLSLYLFMVAVPTSGIFLSNSFRPQNVKLLGQPLPDFWPPNPAMADLGRGLHFWLSYTFLAFVVLHTIQQWKVLRANWRRLQQFVTRRGR